MKKIEILFAILIISLIACIFIYIKFNKEKPSYAINLFYMDTYINVKIYEKNPKVLDKVDELYNRYHELADRYKPYGGVNNVYYLNNVLTWNTPVKINDDLYDLIKYGQDYYKKTNGSINIALGNPINVWKQYRDVLKTGIPTITELKDSGSTNINDIFLKDKTYMKTSNVELDLGAFAKGYVTQLAADLLKENGIDEFIINAGGNVIVGNHYSNKKYKIGIEDPFKKGEVYTVVNVTNKAVVTSGGYERYYTYKNVKYHHIIDPLTLYPPTNNLAAITVIADDSAYADIMSTYLFILGYDKGLKYVKDHNDLDVIWYMNDKTIKYSDGAKAYASE